MRATEKPLNSSATVFSFSNSQQFAYIAWSENYHPTTLHLGVQKGRVSWTEKPAIGNDPSWIDWERGVDGELSDRPEIYVCKIVQPTSVVLVSFISFISLSTPKLRPKILDLGQDVSFSTDISRFMIVRRDFFVFVSNEKIQSCLTKKKILIAIFLHSTSTAGRRCLN